MPTGRPAKSFRLKRMRSESCLSRRNEVSVRGYRRNRAYWRAFRLRPFQPKASDRCREKSSHRRGWRAMTQRGHVAIKARAFLYLRGAMIFLALLLPMISLLPLGWLWLWERGWALYWLAHRLQPQHHRLRGAGDRAAPVVEADAGAGIRTRPQRRLPLTRHGRRASRRRGRRWRRSPPTCGLKS